MQDWQTAFFGLLGAIIGVIASAFWNRKEREDRYKVITFEKRLEAHQSAFYWNQTIYHSLGSGDAKQIKKHVRDAQEWWNANCLLLDEKSRKSFISILNSGNRYARNIERPGSEPESERIWNDLDKNLSDIINGIGAEHLPRIADENRQTVGQTASTKVTSTIWQKTVAIFGRNKWLIPFLVVLIFGVVYSVYLVCYKIPLNDLPTPFTQNTRLTYAFYSAASVAAFIAALLSTMNKWMKIIILVAIYCFMAGMIVQLVSFIPHQ